MDAYVQSRGTRVRVLNCEGRPKVFVSPTLLAKWPQLGKDGSLGSRYVEGNIKRAKQELTCSVCEQADFSKQLQSIEVEALKELFVNPQILRASKRNCSTFEDFLYGAKRVMHDESFHVGCRVVDYKAKRLPLVRVEDADGNDLRDTDLSPIEHGDKVVVYFYLEPYANDAKSLYGCTCKLISVVRIAMGNKPKKGKTSDYSWIVEK